MNHWTIRLGQIFVENNYILFPVHRQRQYSLTNDQGVSHDQIWSNVGNSLCPNKEWMITIGLLMAIATKQRVNGLNSLVLIFPSLSVTSQLMK